MPESTTDVADFSSFRADCGGASDTTVASPVIEEKRLDGTKEKKMRTSQLVYERGSLAIKHCALLRHSRGKRLHQLGATCEVGFLMRAQPEPACERIKTRTVANMHEVRRSRNSERRCAMTSCRRVV